MMMKPIFPEQIDERDSELISAYLRGEVADSEKVLIEERRKTDAEFDKLFTGLVKLHAATRLTRLESALDQLREHAKTQAPVDFKTSRNIWFVRIAAAALLILVVAFVWLLTPGKHDRLFAAHFSNTIVPGRSELGPASPSDEALAFDYYNREQYGKAAREFDRLLESTGEDTYLLYTVVSHLGAGHLDRASALLDRSEIVSQGNREEVVLLRSLLFIRRGDTDKAVQLLDGHQDLVNNDPQLTRLQKDLQRMLQ